MDRTGTEYTVVPAEVDETVDLFDPAEVVMELSERKAVTVLIDHPDSVVIGADTVVAIDGRILGKPRDREEAFEMLRELSGRVHQVYTGVSVVFNDETGAHRERFYEMTEVEMYDNPEELLEWYVDTGEPMDKAGAYGIQGKGTLLVRAVRGNYDNVVGLPVAELMRRLSSL